MLSCEPATATHWTMRGKSCSGFCAAGWLGGPDHYVERFGHPRLRMRHMPFSIGILERDQWLACMDQAMRELGVDGELHARLNESFFKTADWMRNRAGA